MIVDVAEKGSDGAGLARHWAQMIARHLSQLTDMPTQEKVVAVIRSFHLKLKRTLPL